jgi:hypothetical protein
MLKIEGHDNAILGPAMVWADGGQHDEWDVDWPSDGGEEK